MRLSLVIPSFYPAVVYGGPIFATLHAAEALAREGVDVYVSTTNANNDSKLSVETGKFLQREDSLYIKYYNELIVNRFSLAMLLSLWNDIRKADVVHVQSIFSLPTPIALVYSILLGKKVLLSPRGSLAKWGLQERGGFKAKWLKWLISPLIKNVYWHATSSAEKQDILDMYPKADVHLIADGVNCNSFEKQNLTTRTDYVQRFSQKKMDNISKTIVSMGRIHKVKGFDILLQAFKKALTNDPNMVLMIAGKDDGYKSELEELVSSLELSERVFFVGELYDNDKVDFFANADLFVLPSHTENFGIVYAESLASGTPIVASKNTPWSSVEKYDCGMWVDNSVDKTADAIEKMLSKDRNEMRANSRQLAQQYDWKNIAKKFIQLFEEMQKR